MAPIVLWDIDGTLIRSRGMGPKAFSAALASVTGLGLGEGPFDFAGRTDTDIAVMLLRSVGVEPASETVIAVLEAVAVAYAAMAGELAAAVRVLPGIEAVLAGLGAIGAHQSVLTGNIRPAAEHKLAAAGIAHHFVLDSGAYGGDHGDRAVLAALAIERSSRHLARPVAPEDVWIVGDTPRDLACARAVGARCALVATGTFPLVALQDLGADLTLADLSDATALLARVG